MIEIQNKEGSIQRMEAETALQRENQETLPRHEGTVSGKPKLSLSWDLPETSRATRRASAITSVVKG